jgi:hypothetical protein
MRISVLETSIAVTDGGALPTSMTDVPGGWQTKELGHVHVG